MSDPRNNPDDQEERKEAARLAGWDYADDDPPEEHGLPPGDDIVDAPT